MKKYDELIQAVKDGKFRKHLAMSGIVRSLVDDIDEVEQTKHELLAGVSSDKVFDEETENIIIDSAMEALAEKLVADKVFDYPKEIEKFNDLFRRIKDIMNF